MAAAEIQKGRQFYQSKSWARALESFTKAANLCDCNRGRRRERCKCKNYDKAASEGPQAIFREAMHACQCPVARTYSKCDSQTHIMALDYRAATLEAMRKLDHARRDAEWLLELAPRNMEGYLRLGKIVRLQGKDQLAWQIYTAGVHVGRADGRAADPKFQKLVSIRAPLHRRFFRMDLFEFPRDIAEEIFSYFDIYELSRFMRVSKRWHAALDGLPDLWRDLNFDRIPKAKKSWRPPSPEALKKIAKRTGGKCRSLQICVAGAFQLSQKRYNALAPALRTALRLVIYDEVAMIKPVEYIPSWVPENLRSLCLRRVECSRFLVALLQRNQHLEELDVTRIPSMNATEWPIMPQLKCLRVRKHHYPGSYMDPEHISLEAFGRATPNLEQLYLDHFWLRDPVEADIIRRMWPRLEVVRLGDLLPTSHRPPFFLGQEVRFIELQHSVVREQCLIRLDTAVDGAESTSQAETAGFDRLEILRLPIQPLEASDLRAMIGGAVASGRLTELTFNWSLASEDAITVRSLCEAHAWLAGASSIRVLGLHGLCLDPSSHHDDPTGDLATFVNSFPNVEVLELKDIMPGSLLFSAVVLRVPLLAEKILISRTHRSIKKIHVVGILGLPLDKMKELGRKHSVEIIPSELPECPWPHRLRRP